MTTKCDDCSTGYWLAGMILFVPELQCEEIMAHALHHDTLYHSTHTARLFIHTRTSPSVSLVGMSSGLGRKKLTRRCGDCSNGSSVIEG